jgi:signal transduction histidine kinase
MTLRLRHTLALTAVGVVLFGGYAWIEYQNERDDLDAAAIRNIRIIGRSLEVSLGNALRDRQHADIEETLTALEALDPTVDIHVHDLDGRAIAHSRGADTDVALERFITASPLVPELVAFRDDGTRRLVFAARLTDNHRPVGVVAVVRPLDDLDEDLARTRARLFWVVAVFLVGTIVTGLILGTTYLSRPIARLLAGIRKARAGDFRSPVPLHRRDEIGQLVIEFNAMLAALAAARARSDEEAEARVRLEHGLRRIDKLVTIGQLSAGLAHEIGSPLQVLSGRAASLQDHEDAEVRRQAQMLVAECDRITRVVEQLLSFGRRKPATITPCDLANPIRTVIDLLGPEARRRGIELVTDVKQGPHRIEADGDQIQQIALNLINNALVATPRGGTVTIGLERRNGTVSFTVRDTGPGIPADMQARLFEPFFTTRASEGGSGLGLAVVRAIATEHHATVKLSSEPGAGSEFVVSFPALEEVNHV